MAVSGMAYFVCPVCDSLPALEVPVLGLNQALGFTPAPAGRSRAGGQQGFTSALIRRRSHSGGTRPGLSRAWRCKQVALEAAQASNAGQHMITRCLTEATATACVRSPVLSLRW